MGDDESVQMGQNSPTSGMNTGALSEKVVAGFAMNSGSIFRTTHHGGDCFYSSGWDPVVSLSQGENFGTSSILPHGVFANPPYPVELNGTSHLIHYSSDPNAVEMVPKLPVFGGGHYSEMVNPFRLPGCGQNYAGICPEKYSSSKSMPVEKASMGSVPSQEYCQISVERAPQTSPNGKRKRIPDPPSPSNPSKTTEGNPKRDLSGDTSEVNELDEKKQKTEQTSSPNQSSKETGKHIEDNLQDGEGSKGNYIHVRARRGQATNSHSLAERVRREKISERMRLLQELVPGCSKITGKAVMLDEIINYVQSLQQQVEFLSMKLATVNPELDFDIDRILSKDILQLRGGDAHLLGFNPGTSSSNAYPLGAVHQGAVLGIPNASAYHHTLPQTFKGVWDGEMQGLFHTGFDSNPAVANLGSNGNSKPKP